MMNEQEDALVKEVKEEAENARTVFDKETKSPQHAPQVKSWPTTMLFLSLPSSPSVYPPKHPPTHSFTLSLTHTHTQNPPLSFNSKLPISGPERCQTYGHCRYDATSAGQARGYGGQARRGRRLFLRRGERYVDRWVHWRVWCS